VRALFICLPSSNMAHIGIPFSREDEFVTKRFAEALMGFAQKIGEIIPFLLSLLRRLQRHCGEAGPGSGHYFS